MINFRIACLVTMIVCLAVFAILLVAPLSYVGGYGASADAGADFMGRRAAPIFLGLALVTGLLRGSIDLTVQWAVSWAVIVAFLGTALTGIYAYAQGDAAQPILIAAFGEILIAGIFAVSLRRPG